MKIKEIAKTYGIDQKDFEKYIRKVDKGQYNILRYSLTGELLLVEDIPGHVERYKEFTINAAKEAEKMRLKQLEEAEAQRLKQLEAERLKQEEERLQQEEEIRKQKALANMLITSGFSFDGYRITKYSGYISGDDAISLSRGRDGIFSNPTNVCEGLTSSLVKIRRRAIQELKEAAYNLGCNAVIGVDFDYITLDPQTANSSGGTTYLPYVFCVTANGNAVIIEREED